MYKYGLGVSTAFFPFNQADSWQQSYYHTLLATHNPLSGHEKTRETRNYLKICNFNKGNGDQKWKVCKQVRDQIVWNRLKIKFKGCYKMEMNSKEIAISILTASIL